MSTLGESLTQEEIDEMIREADRYGERTKVYIFTTSTLHLDQGMGKKQNYKCTCVFLSSGIWVVLQWLILS